jgi:hypothetical protein
MEPSLDSAPARRRSPGSRRKVTLMAACVIAGIVLSATALLPIVAPLSWTPLSHVECRAGSVVGTQQFWTPLALVNAPYGGTGSVTVHESEANRGFFTARNGSAAGLFVLRTWTLAQSERGLVAGPGSSGPCPSFLAIPGTYNQYANFYLIPENTTSDVSEPTRVPSNLLGFSSVVFHNGYASGDGGRMLTCSSGAGSLTARSSLLRVDVPFVVNGANTTISVPLTIEAEYVYEFPGNAGTWSIDDLNVGDGAPGGGYAFSFAPCP